MSVPLNPAFIQYLHSVHLSELDYDGLPPITKANLAVAFQGTQGRRIDSIRIAPNYVLLIYFYHCVS